MKKEDVDYKIRTHVKNLVEKLTSPEIRFSEKVQQQICDNLSKEVEEALQIKFRKEIQEKIDHFFAELEKDLGYSFKNTTKDDVWCLLLADVGLLDGKKSSDVDQGVSASDTGDEHAVEVEENHAPVEAEKDEVRSGSSVELLEEEKSYEANLEVSSTTETEETQVSDENEKDEVRSGSSSEETQVSDENEKEAAEQPALAEEAKSPVKTEIEKPWAKLLAEARSQKPWTERCDDPEIIRKVNKIIVENTEIDEEKISRDADLRDDLGFDSLDLIEIVVDINREFSIFISDSAQLDIRTAGDAYNVVAYYLKQNEIFERYLKSN